MPTEDPLKLVGTTVSQKYEIERVVGEGGFAIVYRAIHNVWKRPVAIKVFRALGDLPAEQSKQLIESFIQEGTLLTELSERSAAICQARDVGTLSSGGREIPYMVLEWLEGMSLDEVLTSERAARLPPRTPAQALALLEPVAEALALAHRKGVAHRDVKPANVFVLGEARGEHTTKILDFGIAKVVQDAQRIAGSFERTQGVMSSFTPSYGAPEQFSRTHGATGPWTDVFAMGLIFTELVTGEVPLVGDDLTQLAFCAMDPGRRPTPRTLGADVPDRVEAVIRRAVAVAPEERFRDMGELWEALRAALAMEPSRAFIATDPSRTDRNIVASDVRATDPTGAPRSFPSVRTTGPIALDRTVVDVAETTKEAPRRSTSAGLFAAAGGGVALLAALVAGAVYVFAIRGKDPVIATAMGTDAGAATVGDADPVAAAPPAAPPACPAGMVAVPGGKFFMGSDDKSDEPRERPAHQVILSPYCIDATEVTVAQYKDCSDKGECKRASKDNEWEGIGKRARAIYDPLCNIREPDKRAEHPINCIDWDLANAFCAARGKRLPTEAEWEFATRGSDGRKYPWGDDPPTTGGRLNACGKECVAWGKKHPDPENPLLAMYPIDDGFETTAPAGSFPKGDSPFGVHDVVGNVWEWTSDWFGEYGDAAEIDPKGPEKGTLRVMRGGSWNGSDPAWVRPTFRFMAPPSLRSHGIGFRCAMPLVTPDR